MARSADKYLAISTLIKGRITEAYGIESEVVFGPAETSNLAAAEPIPARAFVVGPAQEIVTPLSTGKTWPVTMRDSSLAR